MPVSDLETGPLHLFSDFATASVPTNIEGVYTIWDATGSSTSASAEPRSASPIRTTRASRPNRSRVCGGDWTSTGPRPQRGQVLHLYLRPIRLTHSQTGRDPRGESRTAFSGPADPRLDPRPTGIPLHPDPRRSGSPTDRGGGQGRSPDRWAPLPQPCRLRHLAGPGITLIADDALRRYAAAVIGNGLMQRVLPPQRSPATEDFSASSNQAVWIACARVGASSQHLQPLE